MRMYELWKVPQNAEVPARLEDAGGPVLCYRLLDAEACARSEPDFGQVTFQVVPVRVGLA
jgi:hypothetical protein